MTACREGAGQEYHILRITSVPTAQVRHTLYQHDVIHKLA